MLKRYRMQGDAAYAVLAIDIDDENHLGAPEREISYLGWVRYEDAEALQMRVIELEQKFKTQDELKAEFEKECGDV